MRAAERSRPIVAIGCPERTVTVAKDVQNVVTALNNAGGDTWKVFNQVGAGSFALRKSEVLGIEEEVPRT
jgi:hypothetical protein